MEGCVRILDTTYDALAIRSDSSDEKGLVGWNCPSDHDLSWIVHTELADHNTISRSSEEPRNFGQADMGDCRGRLV